MEWEALLFWCGPGVLAGLVAAGATVFTLSRAGTAGRVTTVVATLAGVGAAVTWGVFALEWLLYPLVSENGPSYDRYSDYMEYRRALKGASGIAIGVSYALLTGSLVLGAAWLVRRRSSWYIAVVVLVGGAIVLPVAVPASLSRVEAGEGSPPRRFHSPYRPPGSDSSAVCCARSPTAPAPPAQPPAPPLPPTSPASDGETKANVLRLARQIERCYGIERAYVRCIDSGELERSGVPLGATSGSVEFAGATPASYSFVGHSSRGNDFALDHLASGRTRRSCRPRGRGDCPASGRW